MRPVWGLSLRLMFGLKGHSFAITRNCYSFIYCLPLILGLLKLNYYTRVSFSDRWSYRFSKLNNFSSISFCYCYFFFLFSVTLIKLLIPSISAKHFWDLITYCFIFGLKVHSFIRSYYSSIFTFSICNYVLSVFRVLILLRAS
jgi:undecaprenyl pyrophosphate phosphatase UppP